MYQNFLRHQEEHEVAFELGTILASRLVYDHAIYYFNMAINHARINVISIIPSRLAEYYIHRASVFEALGLLENSQMDYIRVQQADPTIVQRYIE